MDKLKMQTVNKADENFKKLAELFPNAVTETIVDGEVVRAIDKDVLMQEISATVVEGKDERYQFTWPDKKKAILAANAPINKTLRPCREESVDFDNTENLYIEGDNLEVLKLLQETYLGKIKMIYIDPPYNTGNDFVYNDDFAENADEYIANSGQFDEEGNRLVQNTESNGRFHTDWLNMMIQRLRLAKTILSNEGVIFISIGEEEIDNTIKLCNEVFGEKNCVSKITRVVKTASNMGDFFAPSIDYLLCYAKDIKKTNRFVGEVDTSLYKKVETEGIRQGEYYRDDVAFFQSGLKHGGSRYPIVCPDGEIVNTPDNKPWRANEKTFLSWVENGLVVFKKTNTSPLIIEGTNQKAHWNLYTKSYLKDRQEIGTQPRNILTDYINRKGADLLKSFGIPFDFAKPVDLIKFIIKIINDKEALVVDFFSGSATTAHAVMQLNAEDGGNRKFIMVQLPEETDKKSEAYKAGYKNICEIGKERIRRAGKKIKDELKQYASEHKVENMTLFSAGESPIDKHAEWINPETGETYAESKNLHDSKDFYKYNPDKLDTGFRVLKIDYSNMKDVYYSPDEYELNLFESLADNIKKDRTPEDLLFQVMLDLGILLSSKIEESTIAGKKVFSVADGFLIACFDENVTEETITAVAKQQPYYFVMRDSSMASDSVAANFDQIFATYSPDTVRKVL